MFLLASVLGRLADDAGTLSGLARAVAVGAILWWSIDEIARGVNPWRRILGAIVLAATVVGLVSA